MSASFTDPGRPDHQTAQVNWGDNVVESQAAFSSFTDAFGGATGTLAHTHRYTASGQLELKLVVTDDDKGPGEASMSVRLLTPAEALQEALTLLDAAIANATKPAVRASLGKARIGIVGHGSASDGALRMLAENQPDAAAAFVLVTVTWVQDAKSKGAVNVDALITLLQQVYLSLTGA